MIKANELRIGNEIDRGKITEIHKDGVKVFNGLHYYQDEIFPIPLTPEILEKCGFVKDNYGYYSLTNGVYCVKERETGYDFGEFYQGSYAIIKHVHQLQNLYYALTGTELEINL